MGLASGAQALTLTLQVLFVDLLLSSDNALVIALACRSLPAQRRRQAMVLGTGAAVALRIVLTLTATAILQVPVLKLLGGIALAVIAVQLTTADPSADEHRLGVEPTRPLDLPAVVGTIVLADLVMSADNVVALAAVAQGSVAVLALGLMLSVSLLMYGSVHVGAWLERYPALTRGGGALLGWLAGSIAVSDPLYADRVARQSPALAVVVPLLGAVYVLMQGRIIEQSRAAAMKLQPARQAASAGRMAAAAPPVAVPVAAAVLPALPVGSERTATPDPAIDVLTPPAAPRPRRPLPWRGALIATVVVGAAVGVYAFLGSHWMPAPGDLTHYDCPDPQVGIDFRPGGQRIVLGHGADRVTGFVAPDNQIDWGDLHDTSRVLGVVPPTRVLSGGPRALQLEGGMFDGVTCTAR